MEYRREIDGLRSVAVLPVIAFHAGIGFLSGGFVGVDIFFVISGYLITSILLHDIDSDRFSILKFYERRARRILPALFVVVIASAPFAWLLMTPKQSIEFWHSVISILLFVSNFFFWSQSGYFEGASELKPFLHTWSLAVEEQFYVVFPVLLYVMARWARRWIVPLLIAGTLASLALSEAMSYHQESANFFLTPPRAWELLLGALCAFRLRSAPARSGPGLIDQLLSAGGLLAIIYAILTFSDAMRFPGLAALVPVGGAALLILHARPGTLAARLLSLRPLVGIGLISYSAYLWHQPLFAFARLASMTEPSRPVMMGLAVAALLLGALSWRFVEQPFRTPEKSIVNSRSRVFLASGLGGAALAGLSLLLAATPTYMATAYPALTAENGKRAYEPQGTYSPCPDFTNSAKAQCVKLGDGPTRIVIWGDSHANALSAGAHAVEGYTIYILGLYGCPPIIGVARTDFFGNASNCNRLGMIDGYADYVARLKPDKLFLVARWTMYARGAHVHERLQRNTYFLTDRRGERDGAPGSLRALKAGIGTTVDRFRQHGAQVFAVQQVPDLHDYTPRAILLLTDVPEAPVSAWHAPETAILEEARRHGATVVPSHDLFCSGGRCSLRTDGHPHYIDDSHMNYYGAARLFDRLAKSF